MAVLHSGIFYSTRTRLYGQQLIQPIWIPCIPKFIKVLLVLTRLATTAPNKLPVLLQTYYMKNILTFLIGVMVIVVITIISCAKKDSPAIITTDFSFSEEFDTVSKAVAKGWVIKNNTKPLGTIGWTQGFFYVSMYHGLVP